MKPTTIEEACEARGYDLSQIEAAVAQMPPALQKFVRGQTLRAVLAEAINEGKIPDANDGSWKYEPVFDLTADNGPSGFGLAFYRTIFWHAYTNVGARLQILDEEDAEYFATHPAFMQLHSDALTYKAAETNG